MVFVDRLVATLIRLRHGFPHVVLVLLYEVDRSIVTRAVGEVRRLLAGRGFAVTDRPGVRLRTLQDVSAYARTEGVQLRLDATEIQVCRPAAGRGGRRAFVSGKKKQNTMKVTVIADDQGRALWTDASRPGRMHDGTAARTAGIGRCKALSPPRKLRPGAIAPFVEHRERRRHGHSSRRITVEHALADHKRRKQLQRWTHHRDRLPDTYQVHATLVSDRTTTA